MDDSIDHDDDVLDAYSAVVSGVAELLIPRVASLRMRGGRRGESAGSGVVLTGDGHLLTNAHVVGDGNGGTAEFADGTVARTHTAKVVRGEETVWEGRISTLKRFKDDVKEVAAGYECGIGLEGFEEIVEGDRIETYSREEVVRE